MDLVVDVARDNDRDRVLGGEAEKARGEIDCIANTRKGSVRGGKV